MMENKIDYEKDLKNRVEQIKKDLEYFFDSLFIDDNEKYRKCRGIVVSITTDTKQIFQEKNRARIKELENGRKRDLKRIAELEQKYKKHTENHLNPMYVIETISELQVDNKKSRERIEQLESWGRVTSDRIKEIEKQTHVHCEGVLDKLCLRVDDTIPENEIRMGTVKITNIGTGDMKLIGQCKDCKHWKKTKDTIKSDTAECRHDGFLSLDDYGCIHWEAKK